MHFEPHALCPPYTQMARMSKIERPPRNTPTPAKICTVLPEINDLGVLSRGGVYQAEIYVAWKVLRARGAHCRDWGTRGLQWSFHNSQGYIDAVQSRNPGSSPLLVDLLRACRGLVAEGSGAPQHLYSHRVGTFLDSLLDEADGKAKKQASRAWPELGWIRGLQITQVSFTHNDVQVHTLDCLLEVSARTSLGSPHGGPQTSGAQVPGSLSGRHGVLLGSVWGTHSHNGVLGR